MGFWSSVWRRQTEDWLVGFQAYDHAASAEAGTHYVSVMLRSLHIANVRVGFTRFFGTVQSYSRLPHLSGNYLEFAAITTPSALKDVAKKDIGNFALGSRRLMGPVPYRGGDLELEVGLFAIKSQEMLGELLDLLNELSTAAGVSLSSVASPFVQPLKRGLDLLTGSAGDSNLEIGLASTFTSPIRPGLYFVARIARASDASSTIAGKGDHSVDADYRLIGPAGKAVEGVPYLVFSIDCDAVREDWFMIPEIAAAYGSLTKAIEDELPFKAISSYLEHVRRVVISSPDILPGHAEQVNEWVSKQVESALKSTKTGRSKAQTSLPALGELKLVSLP